MRMLRMLRTLVDGRTPQPTFNEMKQTNELCWMNVLLSLLYEALPPFFFNLPVLDEIAKGEGECVVQLFESEVSVYFRAATSLVRMNTKMGKMSTSKG